MSDPLTLSRPANPDRQRVEVRPLVPVEVVAVIDAVCINEGAKDRTAKVNEILREWAIREAQKATVIVRVLSGNPPLVDSEAQS